VWWGKDQAQRNQAGVEGKENKKPSSLREKSNIELRLEAKSHERLTTRGIYNRNSMTGNKDTGETRCDTDQRGKRRNRKGNPTLMEPDGSRSTWRAEAHQNRLSLTQQHRFKRKTFRFYNVSVGMK